MYGTKKSNKNQKSESAPCKQGGQAGGRHLLSPRTARSPALAQSEARSICAQEHPRPCGQRASSEPPRRCANGKTWHTHGNLIPTSHHTHTNQLRWIEDLDVKHAAVKCCKNTRKTLIGPKSSGKEGGDETMESYKTRTLLQSEGARMTANTCKRLIFRTYQEIKTHTQRITNPVKK